MAPAPKRRKLGVKSERVDELTFDPTARQDYLTGFHKRKQARIQTAREAAIKRDKEEKVKERKQLREQRKEDLEQHVAAVNEELRKQNAILDGDSSGADEADGEEWKGVDHEVGSTAMEAEALPEDEEYVDEDKYTTVTVEPMGESDHDDHEHTDEEKAAAVSAPSNQAVVTKKKRPWAKDGDTKAKVRKKKFRYESKAERAVTRQKQKTRSRKAANARRQDT